MNAKVINTISAASNSIRVTQGEANGIGLEVFFKSLCLVADDLLSHIVLYAGKEACLKTLKSLGIPFEFDQSQLILSNRNIELRPCDNSAFDAIKSAVTEINGGDVLFTLPATKSSFPSGNPGHTAFLRNYYKRELAMFFHGVDCRVLLLTDHIPLVNVRDHLNSKMIAQLIKMTMVAGQKFLNESAQKIVISGVNPHAGEAGVLGDDEELFAPAITQLQKEFKDIKFIGPLSGDIIFQHGGAKNWLVYASHDQGLAPFKATRGFTGANITLGLDFLRLSVDHGTAIDKFGLNNANYMGCLYCLQLAFKSLVGK